MEFPVEVNPIALTKYLAGSVIIFSKYGNIPLCENLNTATNADYAFASNKTLTKIPEDITFENLKSGNHMFDGCSALKNISPYTTFSNLIDGYYLFNGCANLLELPETVNFENLIDGGGLLRGCSKIVRLPEGITFSKMTNGASMFNGAPITNGLPYGVTFESLTSASFMFQGVKFHTLPETVNFKSLSEGGSMFNKASLDEFSILLILDTIPTYTSGSHSISLGNRELWQNSQVISDRLDEHPSLPIPKGTYHHKGWTITAS